MTPTPAALPTRVVVLLALAIFINYIDRGNLAIASPLIGDALGISNTAMGVLFAAFFWSYAPLQPLAGWVAQRFEVRYVLAAGLALWSLATLLTGLATSFTMLLLLRVLLGIGESVAFPCNSKLLAQRSPEQRRGRANGIIGTGLALGPMFGTLAGTFLIKHSGWRATFVLFGAISLLWLLPWWFVTGGDTVQAPADCAPPPTYRELLRTRELWGASIGHLCSNYGYYFVISWLPEYMVKAHGTSMESMALVGGGIYALHALTAALSGWASDRWIEHGASTTRIRKRLLAGSMLATALLMLACSGAPLPVAIVLLLLIGIMFGLQGSQNFAVAQTLAGPSAGGRWMGLQNLIANVSGMAGPVITGAILDSTGSFYAAFALAAGIALVGAAAFGWGIRRVEPVRWSTHGMPTR